MNANVGYKQYDLDHPKATKLDKNASEIKVEKLLFKGERKKKKKKKYSKIFPLKTFQ